jgi:hypothetical protein
MMALSQKIEMQSGAEATYHTVGFELRKYDNALVAWLTSYMDKDAYKAGKAPMEYRGFMREVPAEVWRPVMAEGGNVPQTLYQWMMETIPEFKGAEQV